MFEVTIKDAREYNTRIIHFSVLVGDEVFKQANEISDTGNDVWSSPRFVPIFSKWTSNGYHEWYDGTKLLNSNQLRSNVCLRCHYVSPIVRQYLFVNLF